MAGSRSPAVSPLEYELKGREGGRNQRAQRQGNGYVHMDALFEQLSMLADMALDGGGFDPARLDGVLALFEGEARASWAAAEAEHGAVARATEAAAEAAQGHLDAVMGAAVGTYRGSSGEADALAAATAAMEMAFNATSRSVSP